MITNYIYEIETLKNIKRTGSWIARVKDPDSVAEHIAIASQIAFILGKMENANAEKCACIILFHDNAEIRIWDIHKITARYINTKIAEKTAFTEQTSKLPNNIKDDINNFFIEYSEQKTIEWIIARDADLLELAFQAKIFLEQWYSSKQNWLDNIKTALKTVSAKKIFNELITRDSGEWWNDLKEVW